MAHIFNPNTQKAEVGGLQWVGGQEDLHSEFQDSKNSMVSSQKKRIKTTTKKNEMCFIVHVLSL